MTKTKTHITPSTQTKKSPLHSQKPKAKKTNQPLRVNRRTPNHPITSKTDIYLTASRSDIPIHKRIEKLLFTENCDHVTLHAMGSNCIFKAIKIASDFAEKFKPYIRTLSTTSTEVVQDDCTVRLCERGFLA